jgi:protein-S-isoprenylcysteine O-methyltransferase Ste14
MFWVPPLVIVVFFTARLIELSRRFPVQPGRLVERWSLPLLTTVGCFTVIAALTEYFILRPAPSLILVIAGIVMAVCAFALRAAARRALGAMWSIYVEIRPAHTLVITGPFHYLQHPIYLSMIAELAAVPIVLGAWRAGLVGLLFYMGAVALRVKVEEAAMTRQFGEQWTAYTRKTGRFIPRWRSARDGSGK